MRSPGINGEGELRGQPANPGSPGKKAVKTECVCVCVCVIAQHSYCGTLKQQCNSNKTLHNIASMCVVH